MRCDPLIVPSLNSINLSKQKFGWVFFFFNSQTKQASRCFLNWAHKMRINRGTYSTVCSISEIEIVKKWVLKTWTYGVLKAARFLLIRNGGLVKYVRGTKLVNPGVVKSETTHSRDRALAYSQFLLSWQVQRGQSGRSRASGGGE